MKRVLFEGLAITALSLFASPARAELVSASGTAADLISVTAAPAPVAAPPKVLRADWQLSIRNGGGFVQVSCLSDAATSAGSLQHSEAAAYQAIPVANPVSPWDGYNSNEKPQGFSVGVTLLQIGTRPTSPMAVGVHLEGSANCPASAVFRGMQMQRVQQGGVK